MMKYIVLQAMWILCMIGCCTIVYGQHQCKPNRERFVGTIYYRPWTSHDLVIYDIKDLIQTAKRNCTVVHSHGAMEQADVSKYRDMPVQQGKIDVRIVFIRQTLNRVDTIGFGRGEFMMINGKLLPLDRDLLEYVAVRIPYGFAYPIFTWKQDSTAR